MDKGDLEINQVAAYGTTAYTSAPVSQVGVIGPTLCSSAPVNPAPVNNVLFSHLLGNQVAASVPTLATSPLMDEIFSKYREALVSQAAQLLSSSLKSPSWPTTQGLPLSASQLGGTAALPPEYSAIVPTDLPAAFVRDVETKMAGLPLLAPGQATLMRGPGLALSAPGRDVLSSASVLALPGLYAPLSAPGQDDLAPGPILLTPAAGQDALAPASAFALPASGQSALKMSAGLAVPSSAHGQAAVPGPSAGQDAPALASAVALPASGQTALKTRNGLAVPSSAHGQAAVPGPASAHAVLGSSAGTGTVMPTHSDEQPRNLEKGGGSNYHFRQHLTVAKIMNQA